MKESKILTSREDGSLNFLMVLLLLLLLLLLPPPIVDVVINALSLSFRLQSFPRVKSPSKGNLWLIFRWDESTFKSLKSYPLVPQIVEVGEFLNKGTRNNRRWQFVRKIMLKRCSFYADRL